MIGKRVVSWLWVIVGLVIALVLGGFIGLVLMKRAKTGKWEMPTRGDVVRVKKMIVKDKPVPPSPIIYLHRGKIRLVGGDDDASKNQSSIVARHAPQGVTMPGWNGSTRSWKRVVRCVQLTFRHFAITVTDKRPTDTDNYIMAVVGGRSQDLGVKSKHVGGLAPFNGENISKAVVFAFSRALRNSIRNTCETIAMEAAHAYGLDHGYYCKDVMTYLRGCGSKGFVDKDVRCGEHKKRDCVGGKKTQNSYRHLIEMFGPKGKPKSAQKKEPKAPVKRDFEKVLPSWWR